MQDWKYMGMGLAAVGSLFVLPRLFRRVGGAVLSSFDVTYGEGARARITVTNTGTKTLHLKWTPRYTGPAIYTTGWYDVGTLGPGATVTAPVDITTISRIAFPLGTYNAEAILANFDTDEVYDTATISAAFRVIEIAEAQITSFGVTKV